MKRLFSIDCMKESHIELFSYVSFYYLSSMRSGILAYVPRNNRASVWSKFPHFRATISRDEQLPFKTMTRSSALEKHLIRRRVVCSLFPTLQDALPGRHHQETFLNLIVRKAPSVSGSVIAAPEIHLGRTEQPDRKRKTVTHAPRLAGD